LFVAFGRLDPPLTHPNVALTNALALYVTSPFPRPTSVQVNRRSGSVAGAAVVVRADAVAAPLAESTVVTSNVRKCGKFFALAGRAVAIATATTKTPISAPLNDRDMAAPRRPEPFFMLPSHSSPIHLMI
jgi:hypothetical protein